MYGVVAVGNKQYVMTEGETLLVDQLKAEPGETVSLTTFAENQGMGQADGLVATLRASSGATVSDSVVTWGDLPPSSVEAALTPFTLTLAESVAQLEISFDTIYGMAGSFSFDFGVGTTRRFPRGWGRRREAPGPS